MSRDELTPRVLAAMPVFPLPDCVLLPGCLLPLRVFEPRYRELTRDCLAGGRVMAIARLRAGYEATYHERPPVYSRIGIGRVIDSEEQSDGNYLLVLGGIARADIIEELEPRRVYREVRVRLLLDTAADPQRLLAGHEQLVALCDHLAHLVEGGGAVRDMIRAGQPGECADAVAAAIARDPDERQWLLECLDPQTRLERTIELVGALVSKLAPSRN
jgi:Lon protease-like protein